MFGGQIFLGCLQDYFMPDIFSRIPIQSLDPASWCFSGISNLWSFWYDSLAHCYREPRIDAGTAGVLMAPAQVEKKDPYDWLWEWLIQAWRRYILVQYANVLGFYSIDYMEL